ncbi:MAG TPA: MetQ/NlpA family ABC transporter substrate-binding protein [Clostridiales bacterium]|nr:MetQ/NlpA family ABC transporter substrate-binding protein [Clostridiales bacterium]
MKRILSIILVTVLSLSLLASCSQSGNGNDKKIVIGASPTPHGEILKVVKEVLAEKGYELEIKEFTEYALLNPSLDSGDLDANYFQHQPYLDDYNQQNNGKLISIASIHYEPLGLYPGKTKSLEDLKDGAQIAVPNDTTNEARALLLLEAVGLIKLDPEAGLEATIVDITENPKNLDIKEIEAAQLPHSLQDVDMAVINGNYALQAGLNAATDSLFKEEQDSLAAVTYANIVAVREGHEKDEKLLALVDALKSDKVKEFIAEKYQGAVVVVDD